MDATNVVEIELDAPANSNVRFRPLQASLRGRWEWPRCNLELQRLAHSWAGGAAIPGQVIGCDLESGSTYIADPLHDPAHEALREKIVKAGYKLPAAFDKHEGCDRNTWLFWMRRLVDGGHAKLRRGEFPEIDAKKARKDFLFAQRTEPTQGELLIAALNGQAKAFDRLADVLERVLTKPR